MPRKSSSAESLCPALSAIFEQPQTLGARLKNRDKGLLDALEAGALFVTKEALGTGMKARFKELTDKEAGKVIKALLENVGDEKLGVGLKVVLHACHSELLGKSK